MHHSEATKAKQQPFSLLLIILFGLMQLGCNSSIFSEGDKGKGKGQPNINPDDIDYIVITTADQALGAGGVKNNGIPSGDQAIGAGGAAGGMNSGDQAAGAGGASNGGKNGNQTAGAGGGKTGVSIGDQVIGVGGSKRIVAQIVLKDGTIIDGSNFVNWSTGNNQIASFEPNTGGAGGAVLKGLTPGNTEIIATFGGKTTTAKVQVSDTGGAGGDGGGNIGNEVLTDGSNLCPPIDQTVLVIDLKSGWWAGDAGNFFTRILNTITAKCNGKMSLEYHHITYKNNVITDTGVIYPGGQTITGFQKQTWKEYDQIWLLSGDSGDSEDLRNDDPYYQSLEAQIVNSGSAILIGAGFGSVYHANSLSTALGFGPLFIPGKTHGIVSKITTINVLDRLSMGTHLSEHALFSRGVQNIANNVQLEKKTVTTDFLAGAPTGGMIIGTSEGKGTIAVTTLANDRRIILEAGLQRFYGIYNQEEKDTLIYLENTLSYLSHDKLTPTH
jgi:hypothetical protein